MAADAVASGGVGQRARIVLSAADGVVVKDIVELVGVSKPTVIWLENAMLEKASADWRIVRSRASSGGR